MNLNFKKHYRLLNGHIIDQNETKFHIGAIGVKKILIPPEIIFSVKYQKPPIGRLWRCRVEDIQFFPAL